VVVFFLSYYRWIEESLYALWDFLLFVGIAILFKPLHSKKEAKKFAHSQSGGGDSMKDSNEEIELCEFVDNNASVSRFQPAPACTIMSSIQLAPAMLIVHIPTASVVGCQHQSQPRPMFALAWREE
jgi:hypothetical protein